VIFRSSLASSKARIAACDGWVPATGSKRLKARNDGNGLSAKSDVPTPVDQREARMEDRPQVLAPRAPRWAEMVLKVLAKYASIL
jgi:hypothetical protein